MSTFFRFIILCFFPFSLAQTGIEDCSLWEFGLYDFTDSDGFADDNGWKIMDYADLTDRLSNEFANFMTTKNNEIMAIKTWSAGICFLRYGGKKRVVTDLIGFKGENLILDVCAEDGFGITEIAANVPHKIYALASSWNKQMIFTESIMSQLQNISAPNGNMKNNNPAFWKRCISNVPTNVINVTSDSGIITGGTIICPENAKCRVNCIDDFVCFSKTIQCPQNYSCDIHCSGGYSCYKTKVLCPLNASCHLNCDGSNSCNLMDNTWSDTCGLGTLKCKNDRYCCGVTPPNECPSVPLPPLKWFDVKLSSAAYNTVSSTYAYNISLNLTADSKGNLIVDAAMMRSGCGDDKQTSFAVFLQDIGIFNNYWTRIRYTIEFEGAASCWSILGDDSESSWHLPQQPTTGLYKFNVSEGDVVISDDLRQGCWRGESYRCDNEGDNFFHVNKGKGYKGSLRVELRRNMSVIPAGFGSSYSCTEPGTKIRYTNVQVAYPIKTKEPTINPTSTPTTLLPATSYPTNEPQIPPTELVDISWNVTARFSNSYLKIFVNLTNNNDVVIYGNSNDCNDIFLSVVNETNVNFLEGAKCKFINEVDAIDIIISLSSLSTIVPNDEKYKTWLKPNSFYYSPNEIDSNERYLFNDSNVSFVVSSALSPLPPIIKFNVPTMIGICDDLILDARSTSNLGGRKANFSWIIINSYPNNSNKHLVGESLQGALQSDIIMDVSSTLEIELIVTLWFGQSAMKRLNITKLNDAVPLVLLNANPQIFTTSNKNYDDLSISSLIKFDQACLNESDVLFSSFGLKWNVSSLTTNNLNNLQTYLDGLENADKIIIPSAYMHPGNIYTFWLYINSFSSFIDVTFNFSPIQCQIGSSKDLFLGNVSIEQMSSYQITLDGDTFTFDYDQPSIANKSNLFWTWSCSKRSDSNTTNCDYLLNESNAVQLMSLENEKFIVDQRYIYEIAMSVSDINNPRRTECTDTFTIIANIIISESNPIGILIVSMFSVSKQINPNDRLRILVDVTNWENDGDKASFNWIETTGLLSEDLNDLNQNIEQNANLILPENVLSTGNVYEFELFVTEYNEQNEVIAIGSSSIQITIESPPLIIENSFLVSPQCHVQFESFEDVFSTFYDLSIAADSTQSLSYLYSYSFSGTNDTISLQSSLLSQPILSNTLLPIGEFEIFANVFDSSAIQIGESIKCNISLVHSAETECISFREILDEYTSGDIVESSNELLIFLFQSAQVYAEFIHANNDYFNVNCIEEATAEIISSLYEYLIDGNTDLCKNDYSILLSQTLSSLISLQQKYANSDEKMGKLKIITLDPCSVISNISNLDDLSLKTESIISGDPSIYYQSQDITPFIPIIIRKANAERFYDFVTHILDFIQRMGGFDEESTELINLIYSSIYIHSLLGVSTTIPGEVVDIYRNGISVRASTENPSSLNLSINNISIEFEKNLFKNDGCENSKLCSVDIVAMPVTFTETEVNIDSFDECNDEKLIQNGTLYSPIDATISINLLGSDFNLSALPSNITISFAFNSSQNPNDLRCAWLDETTNIWKYDGCTQYVDTSNALIHCVCDHLTTFATVKVINSYGNIQCDLLSDDQWGFTHFVFAILFLFIACYILVELLPFLFSKKHSIKKLFSKYVQLSALTFAFIISLINMIVCAVFYFQSIDWSNSFITSLTTFLLLFPLIFYFLIFSLILLSWISIALSLNEDSYTIVKNIKTALFVSNAFFILSSIAQIVCLLTSVANKYIFIWMEIIWCSLMLFASIGFGLYGYKMIRLILYTAKKIEVIHSPRSPPTNSKSWSPSPSSTRPRSTTNAEMKIAKKLAFITVVIIIFFLIQCMLTLYFLIDFEEISLKWRIIDLSSHFMCLSIIWFMYHKTMNRIKIELNLPQLCKCNWNLMKKKIQIGSKSYTSASTVGRVSPSVNSTHTPDFEWERKRQNMPQLSPSPVSFNHDSSAQISGYIMESTRSKDKDIELQASQYKD